MSRVTRGFTAHRRHRSLIERARGFRGRRNNVYKVAKQAVMRADQYAYRDRRRRKRDFRALWIMRVNAAARLHGLTYSQFMGGVKRAGIALDRKQLAELAVANSAVFGKIVELAKSNA